jgi:hypothetical protein
LEAEMMDEGPRYNESAKAAADIVNLYMNSNDPPAVKFAKILYRIKDAMDDAEREMAQFRMFVSRN